MARRVIEGQVDVFEVLREGSEGGATSSDPAKPGHLTLAGSLGPSAPLKGKAFGEPEVARATRTSSGAHSAPPSPEGKAFGEAARVLTLAEIEGLEPFRSVVWIETRPWATQQVTKESEIYRFYLLFEALFLIFGAPVDGGRRRYHFRYTYSDGRNYEHHRVDEFYGQEWRVWDKRPTDAQREATPWLSTQ